LNPSIHGSLLKPLDNFVENNLKCKEINLFSFNHRTEHVRNLNGKRLFIINFHLPLKFLIKLPTKSPIHESTHTSTNFYLQNLVAYLEQAFNPKYKEFDKTIERSIGLGYPNIPNPLNFILFFKSWSNNTRGCKK
jgi:hypothetical protein